MDNLQTADGRPYPMHLIPGENFLEEISLDNVLSAHVCFEVIRRSNRPKDETFTEVGTLRSDVLIPNEVPGMSLFMWCNEMQLTDIHFVQKKPAANTWPRECNEPVPGLMRCVGYEEICTPVFFRVSSIHNHKVPFIRDDKEAKSLAARVVQHLPSDGVNFTFFLTLKVAHAPACLNYWHAEIRAFDPLQKPVRNMGSAWKDKAMQQAIDLLLTKNAYPIHKAQPPKLDPLLYLKVAN